MSGSQYKLAVIAFFMGVVVTTGAATITFKDPDPVGFLTDLDMNNNVIENLKTTGSSGEAATTDFVEEKVKNATENLSASFENQSRRVVASAGITKLWETDNFTRVGYSLGSQTRASDRDQTTGKVCLDGGWGWCSKYAHDPKGDLRMFPYEKHKSESFSVNMPPSSFRGNSHGWEKKGSISLSLNGVDRALVDVKTQVTGDCGYSFKLNESSTGKDVIQVSHGGRYSYDKNNKVVKYDTSSKSSVNLLAWGQANNQKYACSVGGPTKVRIFYPNTNEGELVLKPNHPENVNFWSTATHFNVTEPGNSDVRIDIHRENGDLYKKDIRPSTPINDLDGTEKFYFKVYFNTDSWRNIPKVDYLAFNGVT